MNENSYKLRFKKGLFLTLFSTVVVYAIISILRMNTGGIELLITKYPFLNLLLFGCHLLLLIVIYILYSSMGIRTWKHTDKLFFYRGDFFALSICVGTILNYLSSVNLDGIHSGRVLSFLLLITAAIFAVWLLIFISSFCRLAFMRLYNYLKKIKKTDDEAQVDDSVLTDHPITLDKHDFLNRAKFADDLKDYLIAKRKGNYTVGILGKWGTGKSSLLSLVKKKIADSDLDHIHVIDFNPWYFGVDHHGILQKFFIQFLGEIHKHFGTNPKLEREIRQYAKIISSITFRPNGWNIAAKDILDVLLPSDEAKSLSNLKKEIEESLLSLKKTFIVFIDELDRLSPDEIQMVFKLVRLIADFPNIVYVIALDKEVVEESIQTLYGANENSEKIARNYLEKFIQLPIYLPEINSSSLVNLFVRGIEEIRERNQIGDRLLYDQISRDIVKLDFTPRNIKRTLLTYEFYLKVLKEEIHKEDLLQLTMIKIMNPDLYKFILKHKAFFTSRSPEFKNIEEDFKKIPHYRNYSGILLELFPAAAKLFDKVPSELKAPLEGTQKIAYFAYFDRYFQNYLLDNEVSQEGLGKFIEAFKIEEDSNERYSLYNQNCSKYSTARFNTELQHKIERLEDNDILLDHFLAAIAKKYFELELDDRDRGLSEGDRFSCEVIVRIIARRLKRAIFNNSDFREGSLLLWVRILESLGKENLAIEQGELASLVNERMSSVNLLDMKAYADEAREIYRMWQKNTSVDLIVQKMSVWMNSVDDLETILLFSVPSVYYNFADELAALFNFASDLKLLPSAKVTMLCKSYSRKHKLPKTPKELKNSKMKDDPLFKFFYYLNYTYDYVDELVTQLLERANKGDKTVSPADILVGIVNELKEYEFNNRIRNIDTKLQALKDILKM